jgi:hypothetical protein
MRKIAIIGQLFLAISLYLCGISYGVTCGNSSGRGYNFYPTDNQSACNCMERLGPGASANVACELNQYCATNGCQSRLPEGASCPATWSFDNFSKPPCQDGLVCDGGTCRRYTPPQPANSGAAGGTVGSSSGAAGSGASTSVSSGIVPSQARGCYADISRVKKAVVPGREVAGGVDTLTGDKGSHYESCDTSDVKKLSNSLVCFGGPPVPDCSNQTEKQYSGSPSCPPGTSSDQNACWICPPGSNYASGQCKPPQATVVNFGPPTCPPGFDSHDGGCYSCAGINFKINGQGVSSGYDKNGQCKGCIGPICKTGNAFSANRACPPLTDQYNNSCFAKCPPGSSNDGGGKCIFPSTSALRTEQVCPPPPPTWGVNHLPLTVAGRPFYARGGQCFARYCKMTKLPSKVLSCARPPESQDINYPGKIEVSGNRAVCKVTQGILEAQVLPYMACSKPGTGLYCDFGNNVTYTTGGSCCLGEDYTTTGNCTGKFGFAKDGYYNPFTGTSADVLKMFGLTLDE